jgi:Methyltransferase domain
VVLRFDEAWMSQGQLDVLAALAQSTGYLDGAAIEIGTWQGRSAIPLANAIYPRVLHVVDHWQGDDPAGLAQGLGIDPELVKRDNYGIFKANVAEGTQGNVSVWKTDWREFASWWQDPIRFLHLDASHTTQEVADNIRALLPYAVSGTIFAGDDWNWPTVAAGVRQVFPADQDVVQVNTQFDKLWWVVL